MEKATEIFFGIPKGDIGELSHEKRAQMARDSIQIIATGDDERPDLTIWDNGEGQRPEDFKNTFLSIANNNKTDIPFVQGKYNMGSTGAVVFCGSYRYQLIASKKEQRVFDKERKCTCNLFGWTLVRRHILTDEEDAKYGSTWYEYFAIDGEKIPQFKIDQLDIGLYQDKKFTTGSFIKLYSYEMPKGARKNPIHPALSREINQLLYKPSLPIWLYEKRKKHMTPKAVLSIAVYGNHVRINNPDRKEDILECKPIYESLEDSQFGKLIVQAILFKKGENKQQQSDRKRNYIGTGRNIIYILNGQVQGTEGQPFIAQDLKYNFLKDSMLVVIDCSYIKTGFRQDLFMANRSNLRESRKLDLLRSKVIELLKSNEILKKYNEKRKNAVLQGGDDKKEKELIDSLLSKASLDKLLASLLKKGLDPINLPSNAKKSAQKGKKEKQPIETKRFPSIFKINNVKEEKTTGNKVKSIPLNGKGVILFDSDVDEDYFYRPQEKGKLQIHIMGGKKNNGSKHPDPRPSPIPNKVEDFFEVNKSGPNDGSIKLTLKPKEKLNVGDEIELNARLTSPDGDMESIFYVKIVDPQKQETKHKDKEPEKSETPKLIKINKKEDGKWYQDNGEEWQQDQWDENHVIHILTETESEQTIVAAIAINMDSHSLKKYISENKAESNNIEYLRNQYISKIYLHGLFLYSILEKLRVEKKEKDDKYSRNQNDDSDELLAQIFMNYTDVLLKLDINKEILDSLDNGE